MKSLKQILSYLLALTMLFAVAMPTLAVQKIDYLNPA
jgi:hypothetical protein